MVSKFCRLLDGIYSLMSGLFFMAQVILPAFRLVFAFICIARPVSLSVRLIMAVRTLLLAVLLIEINGSIQVDDSDNARDTGNSSSKLPAAALLLGRLSNEAVSAFRKSGKATTPRCFALIYSRPILG